MTRDAKFYDVVGNGLASLGYTGAKPLEAWINDTFANKYNAEQTFANAGFPLNPNIPIAPTYEQIEATIRPYTMAGYVDIDSDGPTKSTDGLALKMGNLPTFKHEVTLSRKILREKMMLMDAIGSSTPEIESTILDLLFKGVDDLLGGNYNTMLYQRHQIVSTGKLVINATNNPLGIPVEIDFGVPNKNKTTSAWYTKAGTTVSQAANVTNGVINPVQVMQAIVEAAEQDDFAPEGHWECDKTTANALKKLPFFRSLYSLATRPDITDNDQRLAFGNIQPDDVIWNFIQAQVGKEIRIIDSISSVEKWDSATKKMGYTNLRSFNEGVLVYVPNGDLGDAQFGKPVFMETPGARTALYDGGRTLIRQVYNDENMIQTIKSEVTGLLVPNKVRWHYYLTVKG